MKKNVLAIGVAAAVAAFAGAANAAIVDAVAVPATNATPATDLAVQAGGIGHILLTPYFTTQDGNGTLLSIVNTDTTNGKAVKVRFRGAANSDDIFDFTLFLSPGDVWTATVTANGDLSHLVTSDTSCTLPSAISRPAGNNFITTRVKGEAAHTREGYIEILNTADIPPAPAGGTNSALYTAIKHKDGIAPCTPAAFSQEHQQVTAANYEARGYDFPTGGLFANWTIVNVANKATNTGTALAVAAVDGTGAPGAGNIVVFPQNDGVVTNTQAADWTADPLLTQLNGSGVQYVRTANYDFPDLSTPYLGGTTDPTDQANDLSGSLAVSQIINEFITDGGLATDWIFSLPTRRYGVAYDYAGEDVVYNPGNLYFDVNNSTKSAVAGEEDRIAVEGFVLSYLDREETSPATPEDDFVISPGNPAEPSKLTFPGEVTVLSFNAESLLGASIATKKIDTLNGTDVLKNGWLNIDVTNLAAGTATGLPIIGYAAARTDSGSNLGGTWAHRWVPAQ